MIVSQARSFLNDRAWDTIISHHGYLSPGMKRSIKVELIQGAVMESIALINVDSNIMTEGSPNDLPDDDSGLPPTIPIPQSGPVLRIVLVTSDDDSSIIIGLQFLLHKTVISTQRFCHQIK